MRGDFEVSGGEGVSNIRCVCDVFVGDGDSECFVGGGTVTFKSLKKFPNISYRCKAVKSVDEV